MAALKAAERNLFVLLAQVQITFLQKRVSQPQHQRRR